jgi:hypothetical protein
MSLELMTACVKTLAIAVQSAEVAKSIGDRLSTFTAHLKSQALSGDGVIPQSASSVEDGSGQVLETLTNRFGDGLALRKLILIAYVTAAKAKIAFPTREERRRKQHLLQWFHLHWELISPLIPCVGLEDIP